MAIEMGLGSCGVCESQIGEGVPIGVLSHAPFVMGHKECVDKKKAEQLMVKIGRQAGPAGPVGNYEEGIQGSVPLEKPEEPVIVEPEAIEPAAPAAVGVSDPWNGPPTEQDIVLTGKPQYLPGAPDYMQPKANSKPHLVPEGGFLPEHFPALSVDLIPYTSNPAMHSDPDISIQSNGWAFIHVGNVRVAIPDREEWDKLVAMMEAMWNTHELHAHAKEVTDGSTDT